MREIVHIQAGQCGNQIGAKVSIKYSILHYHNIILKGGFCLDGGGDRESNAIIYCYPQNVHIRKKRINRFKDIFKSIIAQRERYEIDSTANVHI